MAFEIRYTRLAHNQLKAVRAFDRSAIIKTIDDVRSNTMTRQTMTNLMTPIRDVLAAMGEDGVLLEVAGHEPVAVLPLSDDLIDFLLERSPRLIAECQRLREEIEAGNYVTHEEVLRLLEVDDTP